MKIRKAFSLLSSLVILISMMGILPVAANATAAPFVAVGPKAVRAQAVTSPQSPLYTCQLGLDPEATCYDPFQIRHAYNVDTLLNAGYTGAGRTIVIVDSLQNSNPVFRSGFLRHGLWLARPFDILHANCSGWSYGVRSDQW